MNKNTINQICDKLIMLADNYAEQERILRSLEALVRSLKDEPEKDKPSNKKEDQLDIIERLLREVQERQKEKERYPDKFPFDTHPYLNPKVGDPPGWWKNQPLCNPCSSVIYSNPNIFPNGSSFIGGGSITVVPCSNPPDQQIIYADAKGVHIKDAQK